MDENELINVSSTDALTFIWHPDQYITGHENFGYWYNPVSNTCHFKKARIKGDLSICNKDLLCNIVIEDSYINKVYIDKLNSTPNEYNFTVKNSKIAEIEVSNTKFNRLDISILETYSVVISNDVSIKSIHLNRILRGYITFSKIESDLIEIIDSVTDITHISKIKTEKFNFRRIASKELWVKNSEIKRLKTIECTIGNLFLIENKIEDSLKILNNTKIGNFDINEKELKRLNIDNSYIQVFLWRHDKLCLVNIYESKIEQFNFIKSVIFKDSIFQVINSEFLFFNFALFINNGSLFFSGVSLISKYARIEVLHEVLPGDKASFNYRTFTIDGLFGNKIDVFDFLMEDGKKANDSFISIINSDLGKTSFVACKFEDFDKFYFNNSKVLEIFVADTKFKLEIENIGKDNNSIFLNEQKRLAYGQFKKIYENRGDNVTSTEYLARELETYRKQLKEQKINWSERASLWLNKISSNYGNEWLQAVIVTFGATLICFWIYCMALGYGMGTDIEKMFDLLSYSLEYLNPLRKADFLKNTEGEYLFQPYYKGLKGLARFWDYLSRIVIAYFVYQTIQAFRRFGKTK